MSFKKILAVMLVIVMACGIFASALTLDTAETANDLSYDATAELSADSVAKVGSTEYPTIDEAIAAWTNGTTLTLLDNVTLSDVFTFKSTESRTLDLGTYTMTAAEGKHAIEIICDGQSKATYGLTVKADANNPGSINAPGKSCIYYRKSGSTQDRVIIRIDGGIFNGSYAVNVYSSNRGTNCPQVSINGGVFNGNVNVGHGKLIVAGGTFNGWINCTGDSTAYRQISGGTFKSWQFMTADADNKFWVGTSLANYNVGVYVDDNGYLVVGGPVITEPGDKFEASISEYSKWSSYLKYSSAAANGLYYTDADVAFDKSADIKLWAPVDSNKTTSGTFTLDCTDANASYTGNITLSSKSAKFVIKMNEGDTFKGSVTPFTDCDLYFEEVVEDGIVTITYSNIADISELPEDTTVEAVIDGDTFDAYYPTIEAAIEAAEAESTILVVADITDANLTINKSLTLKAADIATFDVEDDETTLTNVIFTVENGVDFAIDGLTLRGLSYIYAKTPKSISVTNCDIDVTTKEVPRNNTPPAFVLFNNSQGGSVDFTFVNNTLLAAPDATEPYKHSHGITGWNYINSATITGNTFGSEAAPMSAAAVKLMNFVDGAVVNVSDNIFYVNSDDTSWGPNALQLYQCNSRANKYTAVVSGNAFFVDADTAAIGVNSLGVGNGYVTVAADNTVNGNAITVFDVIVFGNSINDAAGQNGYIGVGVEFDENGKIIAGVFSEHSLGLVANIADGYVVLTNGAGKLEVVSETRIVEEVSVVFANPVVEEGEVTYDIVIEADGKIINRLNTADLTFDIDSDVVAYEITAADGITLTNEAGTERYMFNFNGKPAGVEDTAERITIGSVKFVGYDTFTFGVVTADTNLVTATTLFDNIVDYFDPDGMLEDGTVVGTLDLDDATTGEVTIEVPTRALTINISFPNEVKEVYAENQQMTVTVSGGDLAEAIVVDLGKRAFTGTTDAEDLDEDDDTVTFDGAYTVVLGKELTKNTAYNVVVSGAGYRTARYTVTMTDNKTLNFWNNVKDNDTVVEEGKLSEKKNFLAGDIVGDNQINIYDLSAVVSYFATETETDYAKYVKYDLNRDGVIDSKDVAYVLVSWGA